MSGRLILLWLVLGSALVATVAVAGGWRRVVLVWLGSSLGLAALLIWDIFAHRGVPNIPDADSREPLESQPQDEPASAR